jgi:hypothetical protein
VLSILQHTAPFQNAGASLNIWADEEDGCRIIMAPTRAPVTA